jgi:hypothetical protein
MERDGPGMMNIKENPKNKTSAVMERQVGLSCDWTDVRVVRPDESPLVMTVWRLRLQGSKSCCSRHHLQDAPDLCAGLERELAWDELQLELPGVQKVRY